MSTQRESPFEYEGLGLIASLYRHYLSVHIRTLAISLSSRFYVFSVLCLFILSLAIPLSRNRSCTVQVYLKVREPLSRQVDAKCEQ